jgi:hypothetical protein
MNGITRFFKLGAQDADQRIASGLAPRSFDAADRYLASSAVVRLVDRTTHRLQEWWFASQAGRAATAMGDAWAAESWKARYQALGALLVSASLLHVALTAIEAPRVGWFWLVIPVMTLAFGALLLVAFAFAKATADQSVDKPPSSY